MSIPDYQSIMLPLLKFAGDEQEHASRSPIDALAEHFHLTALEREATLASGKELFVDRVQWALTYLRQAQLVETTRRGFFRITPRGIKVLASMPAIINNQYLAQFPEFREFLNRKSRDKAQHIHSGTIFEKETNGTSSNGTVGNSIETIIQQEHTPSETIEDAIQTFRHELALDLIDRIKACSPKFFERLVITLLVSIGYGGSLKDAGEVIGRTGDEGIDGIIKEDRLGLDVIYVQAKRWDRVVGRPEIQQFAGALHGQRARKGIFITTSSFTREAREYVTNIETKIVLIDGSQLAELMIDHDVGVTVVSTYLVKRADADFFSED